MPKLGKEIVNKIKEMICEGLINSEIRSKTGISLPTIRKLRKEVEREGNGKEGENNKEVETADDDNVFIVGEGNDSERLELFDLKGKKIRFTDVVDVKWFSDGWTLEESTLPKMLDFYWGEIDALKEGFEKMLEIRRESVECSGEIWKIRKELNALKDLMRLKIIN